MVTAQTDHERRTPLRTKSLKFLAAVVALLACGALVAPALSSRAPTKAEKKAIKHAFKTTKIAGLNQVATHFNVVGIRVSTVNSHWAKASFVAKPRYRNTFQNGYGVAKRGKHGWKAKDVGSSGVGCGIVPKKVFKDLKLGTCPG
jgi:hypothetical protein